MIWTKKDLKEYLEADRLAMDVKRKHPRIFGDEVWKYEVILRKCEYYLNVKGHPILKRYYYARHHFKSIKLGILIPPNAFGKGLRVVHCGGIVVNPEMTGGGENCTIHQGVTIGKGSDGLVPKLGDNVWIGAGAKIFGGIEIADGCKIGANAVVNRSCTEQGKTIVGVPAKVVR